ncbi:MAG: hypothetical protein HN712_04460 [Gemmatimonadetes bacterium]|jgi:hypothetical protein|nr:hypothetical protein [Gemmatimonadota bacterium]MBT6150200.1 hypothetical protein [Gemmatimonadota bacterium]MBT7859537.1 hypothetical protein [Gemmatimonadota bacterium]
MMTSKTEFLARLRGVQSQTPLYVPDLTLWHTTHTQRGTLPAPWQGLETQEVAAAMGVTAWMVVRPWTVETPGVEVSTTQTDDERITRWQTEAGTLSDRWTLGPDGGWWQMEYPVKSVEDLTIALEVARARTYSIDADHAAQLAQLAGSDEIVAAMEIPTRPFSDLLYDLVGLTEGPMMLMMGYPEVDEIIAVLEDKLAAFVPQLAGLTADAAYSPDNLDRQFLAPTLFEQHMADSYRCTTQALDPLPLVVHAGGPVRDLLAPVTAAGVAAVEGVCGPPQSDATLAEARTVAGPELTLWGGIPQDALLVTTDQETFEAAVATAVGEASDDGRVILGVADRVPVDAEPERLAAISDLVR